MTDMQYVAPTTLEEAIGAFAAAGNAARILAGGTDLLVQMRAGIVKPGLIVDIKKIAEMTEIAETADGGFRIGAAVSGAKLAEHPRFREIWPGVLEAVNLIGSKQVQGRASAGGNLCNASPAGDSVPAMIAADAVVSGVAALHSIAEDSATRVPEPEFVGGIEPRRKQYEVQGAGG
jgi:aerobic carbon-monoxide dehydrogenase medium subunit